MQEENQNLQAKVADLELEAKRKENEKTMLKK